MAGRKSKRNRRALQESRSASRISRSPVDSLVLARKKNQKTENLEREVERQRRVIEEHQATISALRRGRDEAPRSFHDGPGEGEPYNPRPQRSSAPLRRSPRKLQSVVRVVPRPIRPKPQQRPWH